MLAKVIKLDKLPGGRRISAKKAIEYIFREGAKEHDLEAPVTGGALNLSLDGLDLSDPQDRELAAKMMDYTAEAARLRNRFMSNPYYHYVLSWREGEHPTREQCEKAVLHTLKALGLHENQAVWALHTDKENHWHIHIFASRVHPDRLNLVGPPKYDYLVLDKACRELELAQGWAHDHGPHVVIDGEIKRLSKKQRQELGLLGHTHAPVPGARAAEVHSGVPSLSEWLRSRALDELLAAQSWSELHAALAARGCALRQAGGGLVIDASLPDGRKTATKASGVHYSLSMGRLEKRLGPFLAPDPSLPLPEADPAKTYARFVENVRAGVEPGVLEIPGHTGDTPERRAKREARAAARKELAEAYKREQENLKASKKVLRAALRERHAAEMNALRRELSSLKPTRIAELAAEHGSKRIAQGLWAAETVIRKQELQKRHLAERAALTKDLQRLDWVEWLEKQASLGNEAAAAALRGIRYRESRDRRKGKNGFEGEDLEPLRPVGSIQGQEIDAGARKKFTLENARIEVDRRNQRIEYRDADGQARLTDLGQRIDVHVPDADTIEVGLLLAAQKYGGEVYITGTAEFREQAARQAARLGIVVKDADLQHVYQQERARMAQERSYFPARQQHPERTQDAGMQMGMGM